MNFKKVDHSKASFGFIAGLAVGIVVGVLFTQNKTGTIKEERTNKQAGLIKTDEIAGHLAYMGHQAEQNTFD